MLSLCMILRNEQENLHTFLHNINQHVDEIIVVDTGSVDNTKQIADKFTKNVFDFRWNDDFAAARNFSISKATHDWILIMDPDEIIEKADLIKIKNIIKENRADILGYRLIQKTFRNNKIISVRGICRVFKNSKDIRFIYPIHETVRGSIKGKIGKTGIIIKHYPTLSKEKHAYYLSLLKTKKQEFPKSSADKEIELENINCTDY